MNNKADPGNGERYLRNDLLWGFFCIVTIGCAVAFFSFTLFLFYFLPLKTYTEPDLADWATLIFVGVWSLAVICFSLYLLFFGKEKEKPDWIDQDGNYDTPRHDGKTF